MKKLVVCVSFLLAALFAGRSLAAQGWTIARPDLQITSVLVVNDYYALVRIENRGLATAGANYLSLQVDGVFCNYVALPSISPGSWNGRWVAVYNLFSFTNNVNVFRVDHFDAVRESNEANNSLFLDRRLR